MWKLILKIDKNVKKKHSLIYKNEVKKEKQIKIYTVIILLKEKSL